MSEAPIVAFDNASRWANLTSWTTQHLRDAVNVSKFAESILQKLGYFLPADNFGQRIIPDPTSLHVFDAATTGTEVFAETVRSGASSAASSVAMQVLSEKAADLPANMTAENGKGLGSFFSYMTSKWSLSCIVMAIILNRTHIFAATRRRLRLRWHTRVSLRIVPILVLFIHALRVLRSIQCQTSPDFSGLRFHNASMKSDLHFANPNVFMNRLSSSMLMGATDRESCEAIHMIPTDKVPLEGVWGSLSILWPLYGAFCLSQFLETVSCSVQGRPTASETGMTLFEISLAFAEADAAMGNQLNWGAIASGTNVTDKATGKAIALTRSMILQRVNTPVEVLTVALICIFSHITSHFLGMAMLQSKFRLLQTSLWAVVFLLCLLTSFWNFSLEDPASQGLLRFPTVCLIGHVPHIIVLLGIIICSLIYAVALIVAVASPPAQDDVNRSMPFVEGEGFWGRLAAAHSNMQAHLSLSDVRISCATDFYTALLRSGMAMISMASEAVYLQEDRKVNLKEHTWLEDERFKEIERYGIGIRDPGYYDGTEDNPGAMGMVPIKGDHLRLPNGYARERAGQEIPRIRLSERKPQTGVGAAERSTRWMLAVEYICRAVMLFMRIQSRFTLATLAWLGLRWRPRWLLYWSETPESREQKDAAEKQKRNRMDGGLSGSNIEILSDGTVLRVPRHLRGDAGDVDVEQWMRKTIKLRTGGSEDMISGARNEEELDKQLYQWWLRGGFFGTADGSGEYAPDKKELDDDATSVISNNTVGGGEGDHDDASGWESYEDEDVGEGQRTPTQDTFDMSLASRTREGTPMFDSPMPASDMARLLDPSSPEEREQAKALAAHLQSDRVLTRSRYKKVILGQRSRVLGPGSFMPATRTGEDDEAAVLERILLSRRAEKARRRGNHSTDDSTNLEGAARAVRAATAGNGSDDGDGGSGTWKLGASGLGEHGPQCVVCHSEPRTIIVWPCRCLSLCDECRVNLAINNYGNCVCCRREVVSFSRIYVP